jgi:hypothetical protein
MENRLSVESVKEDFGSLSPEMFARTWFAGCSEKRPFFGIMRYGHFQNTILFMGLTTVKTPYRGRANLWS